MNSIEFVVGVIICLLLLLCLFWIIDAITTFNWKPKYYVGEKVKVNIDFYGIKKGSFGTIINLREGFGKTYTVDFNPGIKIIQEENLKR